MTPPTPGRVRCLAPARPDHWFHSPDRLRVRFCPRCRRNLLYGPAPSPVYAVPTTSHDHRRGNPPPE